MRRSTWIRCQPQSIAWPPPDFLWSSQVAGRDKSWARAREFVARHHSWVREWLILAAAVIAVVVGFQQIGDEREARRAVEQRLARSEAREQAEKIAAWIARDHDAGMDAVLANRSEQPVYQVILWRVAAYGAGARSGRELDERSGEYRTFAALPPGEYATLFQPGFNGMGLKPGVEIAFRDQAGVTWVRFADGRLRRTRASPVEFYGLNEAQGWETPNPAPTP